MTTIKMTRQELGCEFQGDVTRIYGGLQNLVKSQEEANALILKVIASYESGAEYADLIADLKNWKNWN